MSIKRTFQRFEVSHRCSDTNMTLEFEGNFCTIVRHFTRWDGSNWVTEREERVRFPAYLCNTIAEALVDAKRANDV